MQTRAIFLAWAAVALCAHSAGAARPLRGLQGTDAAKATPGSYSDNLMPGDVLVIDTYSPRAFGDRNDLFASGVMANDVQSNAGAGSTFNVVNTVRNTQKLSRADQSLRTAIGTQEQSAYVSNLVDLGGLAEDSRQASSDLFSSGFMTSQGTRNQWGDPTNRAGLSLMDTSAAVQEVTRGMGRDSRYATSRGAAGATSVLIPGSYYYNMIPTWWRRR